MSTSVSEMIPRLRSRLEKTKNDRSAVIQEARANNQEALSMEQDALFRAHTEEIGKLEERLAEIAEQEQRSGRVSAALAGQSSPTQVYGPEQRNSYFADLTAVTRGGDHEAQQRLSLYAQENRDLNRADGSGGFFVPPAWLISDFVGLPRSGRVTADLLNRRPLPPGTDSINIPRVLTGTATAIQPADNDPIQELDLTDAVITAPVRTIAGQQDVAQQLLDQSPVNFDEIIFTDLLSDFNQKLNAQVLGGTGAAGQVTGLRNVAGITTVPLTGTTVAAFYSALANAVQKVSGGMFSAPNAIVMHPRRWAWLISQLDANSRPLVIPAAYGPSNAVGLTAGGAEGRVGEVAGLPVYVDGGIPTNLGVGTNEDVILVLRTDDTVLFESTIRTRVLPQTLSGTLTVRLQIFGYLAMATRQSKSLVQISGAGLVAPTFA